jgi:hypothetical protein
MLDFEISTVLIWSIFVALQQVDFQQNNAAPDAKPMN